MKQANTMYTVFSLLLSVTLSSGAVWAQSCNDNITASTPDARFIVSGDEVEDVRTNLIWKRCAEGQTWDDSTTSCTGSVSSLSWLEALALADEEWRLPNVKELLSIVEVSCAFPAINETVFPNTPDSAFWTSSPYINNAFSWAVLFEDGNDEGSDKSIGAAIRLVKDAS